MKFFRGVAALARGLDAVVSDPKLRRLALAPVVITVVAAIAAGAAAWHFGARFVASIGAGHGPLVGMLLGLALAVAVVAAAVVGYLGAGLIATAPFSEPMSERAETLAGGKAPPHGSVPFWTGVARDVGQTLATVSLNLVLVAGVFAVQLAAPILAPLTGAAGFAITAWFLAFDAFDPTLSRHGMKLADKRAFLRAHRAEALGLGAAGALVALVPLVGLLVPPALVVAGAFLHAEMVRPGPPPASR